MKKLTLYILLVLFVFFMPFCIKVYAWPLEDVEKRNACNTLNYELAYANPDLTLSNRSCHSTYQEAKNIMNGLNGGDNDNLVIIERREGKGYIIDAKYGMLDYDLVGTNKTSNLYLNSPGGSAFTYVSGLYSDDAPLLDFKYSDNIYERWARIKLSGVDCWFKFADSEFKKRYDILPLSWARNLTHYEVANENIKHVVAPDMYNIESSYALTIGPRPSFINNGTYYSYDGKYFYTDMKTLINDYRAGNTNNAVNPKTPYYNYYLYLSHRSKTLYTKDDIDNYTENVLGYKSKIINGNVTKTSSMLYKEGESFINSQESFGVNALLMYSVAMNESGRGRSTLSYQKNNIFGHSAYDSDPFVSGSQYTDIASSIKSHAYRWMSFGYLTPTDYRYFGASLGTKRTGINVKYASDPYWGEKAAAIYYQVDRAFGLQDYNYYRIGVLTSNVTVYPMTSPSGGTKISNGQYKISNIDSPIVIVGETTGTSINGNNKWYKIISDPTLDDNKNMVAKDLSKINTYNWQGYTYVPAAYFTVINPEAQIHDPIEIGNGDVFTEGDTGAKYIEENPGKDIQSVPNNLYYFESLTQNNDSIEISGFLGITGMNNAIKDAVSHQLILRDVDTNKEYIYPLKRWISNTPFTMSNAEETVKYDYAGGWFKGRLDLSNIPQGNYRAYIQVINNNKKSETVFNNIFYKDMNRKVTLSTGKGISFNMNYLEKSVPMEIEVRDKGLLSSQKAPTTDMMFNSFQKIEFIGSKLHIRGTSHNVGIDYSTNANVKRQIVFENTKTFERYTYEAGSIIDGDYKVTLRADDGKDKTRAWFDTNIDLTKMTKGVYAIYIVTESNGFKDYGELTDLLYNDINKTTTIDSKKVSLRRLDNKRFRIELVIE